MTENDVLLGQARALINELRATLGEIRYRHPAWAPGTGPTAADNCKQLLDLMDHAVDQLAVYVGPPDPRSLI
jgi:hypothetical protein